ncbi:thiopeptide-type bacteriocin biosynthesis protein [Mucilaginibacter sp. Mucisp86]|uniref:lantibiotic dehydratase n=1 Tax=Mucilaginibacter sp. Mucisp86 TaxID=3243060 RepID=UPI0039B434A3
MIKLKLHNEILCRTPAFSLIDTLEQTTGHLKEMIKEASPDFYQVINDQDFVQLNNSLNKVGFSIWKYFNRAKYRATPYGSFAAISLLNTDGDTGTRASINNTMQLHRFINWQHKDAYVSNISNLIENIRWFQTNTSVYKTGSEYRYIRVNDGKFEIASVAGFAELDALLAFCSKKACNEDVCRFMFSEYRLKQRDVFALLRQLVGLQLLLTDKHPNIIGPDYFSRVDCRASNGDGDYIIASREVISGTIDKTKLKNVPEMLSFMARHLPGQANSTLNDFTRAFLKKFEGRSVPLTIALDPELGIGYGDMGEEYTGEKPVILHAGNKSETSQQTIVYTALHKFILNNLCKPVIKLEEFSSDGTREILPLPNTFSVLMHFWNDKPVIENAGGCTANALLGRFTIADTPFKQMSRKLADIEQQANPDVLFFDIAYQAEKQVDNVNRRSRVYAHELPILTWSCHEEPLQLNEILVSVRGKEIILWSKQLNKRIVPRIPSAYNYTRSDLAVYRFLCDLQHQQISSDLNFKIQHFFPGLDHYPKVIYKDIVVAPASWKIPQSLYRAGPSENVKDKVIGWLTDKGISFLFKSGFGDQTLCFNPKLDADMDAFAIYLRQYIQQEIYITEVLNTDADGLSDNDGKRYAAEYILNYTHDEQVYDGINIDKLNASTQSSNILPGGDWIYFEIYCSTTRANNLLTGRLNFFLRDAKWEVAKWFFIRYEDPKPHIRLRLQLKHPENGSNLTRKLNVYLARDFTNGVVTDVQIKTYYRETDRYGYDRMPLIESFFFADSKYVLKLIEKALSGNDLYNQSIRLMAELLKYGLGCMDEEIEFVRAMADSFKSEFGMGGESFRKINQDYAELRKQFPQLGYTDERYLPSAYVKLFRRIMDTAQSQASRHQLIADLIHMHVNRLFNANQRAHEAVLYHYLLKVLQTRRAFSKQIREWQD